MKTTLSCFFLLVLLWLGTATSQAQTTYYQDGFSRSGELQGTAPDVHNTSSNTWTVSTGTGAYATTGSVAYDKNAAYDAAWLPVNGTSGVTLDGTKNFTLSALITPDASGYWLGISLNSAVPGSGGNIFSNGLFAVVLGNGYAGAFNGSNNLTYYYSLSQATPYTVSLVYSATASTITYSVGGATIYTLNGVTASQIASTRAIALGNSACGTSATFDNYTLTVAGGTTYPLTVTDGTGGNGTVTLSPSGGSYAAGTVVTMTADPKSGYTFSSWTITSGSGTLSSTTTSPTTLTMAAGATAITANYVVAATYPLTVAAGSGGTVTSTPASGGSYTAGTAVSIKATPNAGYSFVNWTGSGSTLLVNASSASTTLTNGMPASAVSLTANFAAAPTYSLTVTDGTGGNGAVTLSPSGGSYTAGTVVTLTADPKIGYAFSSWTITSGSGTLNSTTTSPANLTMAAGATAITANYSATAATSVTSVQFPQYYSNSIVAPMNYYNSTGGVVSVQNWNVADTNTGTSPASNSSLVNSSGGSSGTTVLINSTGANTSLAFTYSGYTNNDNTENSAFPTPSQTQGGLADQYIAGGTTFNGTGAAQTLTVSGLTSSHTYNLIVYVTAPWWQSNGSVTASVNSGATTYYITTSNTLGSWTQATSTSSGSPTTGNYVKFSNLTGVTSQTVTLTGTDVGLAGFQVVDNGSGGTTYSLTVAAGANGTVSSTPASGGSYAAGTAVSVTATANSGYQFVNWTGTGSTLLANASSASTTLTNGMPASAVSLTANFAAAAKYALTVTDGTGGNGAVTLSPSGGSYTAGTVVTITADPKSGYTFSSWSITSGSGTLSSTTTSPATLTMAAGATAITANYAVSATKYALTVTDGTGGNGAVTLSPSGGSYTAGTVVAMTADPQSGYTFSSWSITSGSGTLSSSTASPTNLTMSAGATAVTANYTSSGGTTYALTVTNGSGSGNYAAGTVVSITASAAPTTYKFNGWTVPFYFGGTFGNAAATSTTYTMPANSSTITGTYVPSSGTTYALTVSGGTGSGSYLPGTIVVITPNQAPGGQQFVRWTGTTSALLLSSADSSYATLTMPAAATTITAFNGATPTLYAVTVNGGTINNDTGSGQYAAGTVLSVTANTPAGGSNFTGWTGTTSALANAAFATTNVTVPASAVTITANYATTTSTYALTVNSGTGGGTYAPGTPVTVTASAPASGMQFSGWTGTTSALANMTAPTTTLFMPSGAASITANYTTINSTGTLILAVGLEKIVPTYTGPLIRVQRPSDNTQMDFYPASGSNLLNTSAVTTFLGQSQGYITTLYAQDGSGHNLTTPLPTSTTTMPTISVTDPTTILVNGSPNLTARNIEQPFTGNGQGTSRVFVLPPSVAVNRSQTSAFIALGPDYSGSGNGVSYMDLYEVGYLPPSNNLTGNPAGDAFDLMSCGSGLQGLTHSATTVSNGSAYNTGTENFASTNVVERSQPTVLGLTTAPGSAPLLYLDGVQHATGGSAPSSETVSGGFLLGGNGASAFYSVPLFSQYNFLGFALYSGTVSSSSAATISSNMLPRTTNSFNIVAEGDSQVQGTGAVYGYNMLHYVSPLLNHPADITNIAVYGTTSPTAVGAASYPTPATSDLGLLYNPSATKNIYYLAIGTNDIHNGILDGTGTWNEVQMALQDAKNLGYKTVVATILHAYGDSATITSNINTFNSLARAAVGQPYLDAIVDFDTDVRLGNTGIYYPAFSGDGEHPNDTGYQLESTLVAPVLNNIIGP